MFDLHRWAEGVLAETDRALDAALPTAWPTSFTDPLRYPVFGGGKRMRPLLAVAAYEGCGGVDRTAVLPAAAAVELVHTYSLVHDDLPAMDDDDERRGRPTVHKAWDEGTAVLVGDALLTEAFAVLAAAPWPAAVTVAQVRALAQASGYHGMVGGQVADIALGARISDVDTLMRVHRLKTGALIHAAVTMGGRVAGDRWADALDAYGHAVGLAFQLADDVLDEAQDAARPDEGPPSYVRLLGVDETLRRARALADEAESAVAGLPNPSALIALARYTVERDR